MATDGAIRHVWWDPIPQPFGTFNNDQWSGPNLPTNSQRPDVSAAGVPATMVSDQQQHIFYRGTDGAIYHVFWDIPSQSFGNWDQWTLPLQGPSPIARTQAPAAAGDPATMVADQKQHIFYRNTDGGIWHVFWDESTHHFGIPDQWSGPNVDASNRPTQAAACGPATMVTAQQQHMFYCDTDGAIRHVWWDPSLNNGTGDFRKDQCPFVPTICWWFWVPLLKPTLPTSLTSSSLFRTFTAYIAYILLARVT
jgi:hypothetical protein